MPPSLVFENFVTVAPFAVNRPLGFMPPLIELPATINTKLELTLLTLVGTFALRHGVTRKHPPLVLINRTE